ncbi:hypothetical protein [Perlabentimonas gracilis]|uniref:hypothetical protein n=1 Tax=Perlabentimonas gracilis TaxID=2715279 RepID=UPI00140C3A4D|nr:hypothetical protein [Perlabentimonas gracilis]NHB67316.1 hypothetical protein [Perlabentimonas gracilis]
MSTNNYEEEIYKFLTQPDNYENLLSLVSNFEMIKAKLIKSFRLEVSLKVEERLKSESKDNFVVKYNNNKNIIEVYKQEWFKGEHLPIIKFVYAFTNNPYTGIKHNNESKKLSFQKAIEIREEVLDNLYGYEIRSDEGRFIVWKRNSAGFDISNDINRELKKILPECREEIVQQFTEDLVALVIKSTSIIDELIEKI